MRGVVYGEGGVRNRTGEIGRAVFCQFVIVGLLQIDHHQKTAVRRADIGTEINDRVHLDHPAVPDRVAPLLADISRMPGPSQSPSGRMMTYGSPARLMLCGCFSVSS